MSPMQSSGLPPWEREIGTFLGFQESQKHTSDSCEGSKMSLSCIYFPIKVRVLQVDCFFLKSQLFLAKLPLLWNDRQWRIQRVTLNCSLLRHSLLRSFPRCSMKNIGPIWHFIWETAFSLGRELCYPGGHWLYSTLIAHGRTTKEMAAALTSCMRAMSQGSSSTNSLCSHCRLLGSQKQIIIAETCLLIHSPLLKLAPRSLFLLLQRVSSPIGWKSNSPFRKSSSELSGTHPTVASVCLSCTSGRVYASLCLSPQNHCCYSGSHRPKNLHCSCFKLIGSIQFYK